MKVLKTVLKVVLILFVAVFVLAMCTGSDETETSSAETEPRTETAGKAEQEEEDETLVTQVNQGARISLDNADFKAESATVDENGFTFTLSSRSGNVGVYPSAITVNGETLPMFVDGDVNPRIHMTANGSENSYMFDVMENGGAIVNIRVDGVDEYETLEMSFDESLWSDSNPKAYEIQGCRLTVTK